MNEEIQEIKENNSNESIVSEVEQINSSPNIIESTPEKMNDDSKPSILENILNDSFLSSPKILEPNSNPSSTDCIDPKDNVDKQEEPLDDVKFLPVNQFRLKNDEERTMCIKQQKNSWLQLNDSKKDFQSVIDKSSVTASMGPLSTLKRDREEQTGEKRVKRKISDYFSPKN